MTKKSIILILFICMIFAAGCGAASGAASVSEVVTEVNAVTPVPGEYDSLDTAIITKVNTSKKEISFYNYDLQKSYTLVYDSITDFKDKYSTAISPAQLSIGSVADIKFLKSGKLLTNLSLNASVFSIPDITGFSIETGTKVFNYKSESYKITSGTVLLAGDDRITLNDLDKIDTVTITGIDTTIYSVTVTKGHGYLTLSGEDKLIDGLLELNGNRIEKITKDFRVPVEEGPLKVKVTKDGIEALIETNVVMLEDTVLDLSEIQTKEDKVGKVLFAASPSDAKVYIDGELIDTSKYQELEYGMHKLYAVSDGYDSITRYFNVGEEKAVLGVTLESNVVETEEETTTSSTRIEGYYVFISAPSDVEVTIDGVYKGISPLSVYKESGSHTISLRKNGYKTRSYTVVIDTEEKDTYLTFEELEASAGENAE